ncbi:MAG: sigma-E factor negative regulatory protein [Burkholderiaceae bacterium]|nr:sigma-E factor negative regulatory protein [Burkholderiaceae bacterium]
MADHSGSGSDPARARGEELSALLDGELPGAAVERICAEWRTDARSRDTWHAYNLIGDVMRCEDLSRSCASDEQFLRDFRTRMAAEPVVLAPRPVSYPVADPAEAPPATVVRPARAWAWPVALAAGFVVVVGAVVGIQNPAITMDARPLVAAAPAGHASEAMLKVSRTEGGVPPSDVYPAGMELVFDGQVIRDPRLDRYLLAHKQFAGTSVLGPTSGLLRNAAVEVPER